MSTPINLNKARKARTKAGKARRATENRAKFGRTKAEKSLEKARADKLSRLSDGHRLTDDPEGHG